MIIVHCFFIPHPRQLFGFMYLCLKRVVREFCYYYDSRVYISRFAIHPNYQHCVRPVITSSLRLTASEIKVVTHTYLSLST